jgi:hypothetical protein
MLTTHIDQIILHYTQAGLRSQIVPMAMDEIAEVPPSKRTPLIADEDYELNVNLKVLDEGTRARNRAFQERLDEVWSQTSGWEARLRTEEKEAEETIIELRQRYEKHTQDFHKSLQLEIHQVFDKIDNELIPPQHERLNIIDQGVDKYFHEIVPHAIEMQTGIVSRMLKKAYETFAIEQQKEKRREMKLASRASEHIQRTAQKFTDEDALLRACFHTLDDDVVEAERRAARMHLRRWDENMLSIKDAREIIKDEADEREREDVDLLDTVVETQQLLQRTVSNKSTSSRSLSSASSLIISRASLIDNIFSSHLLKCILAARLSASTTSSSNV